MLRTLEGKEITQLPHAKDFAGVVHRLGAQRTTELQDYLDRTIDALPPDKDTRKRKFNSAYLGSELSPWQYPLLHLCDVAREIEGPHAEAQTVQDRAGLLFGLFVWERIMNRNEEWVVYDPNLGNRDLDRVKTGKVYFEQ